MVVLESPHVGHNQNKVKKYLLGQKMSQDKVQPETHRFLYNMKYLRVGCSLISTVWMVVIMGNGLSEEKLLGSTYVLLYSLSRFQSVCL